MADAADVNTPDLMGRMRSRYADVSGSLEGLAEALDLREEEMMRLAWAFSYEREV